MPQTSAELLTKHDDPGSKCCTTVTRHGKELGELGKEVLALVGLALELNTDVCVVRIPGSLYVGVSKALEGSESLVDPVVLDVPSASFSLAFRFTNYEACHLPGRLGAKVNLDADNDRQDDSASEHQSPAQGRGNARRGTKGDAHDVAKHDTKGSPHLPF